ncbi:hypothetical protein GLOIN_2v458148 [Rhizophagus irregularis DAOM 181602=DAOM 197198]|uniref:Uncharacterized protein n=1 Tax=Rhizophagus irregularis (strain DAOM 181602 / DAOM 197198 / MUCL 43194) TaxID=747089 RepID=A0A2P4QPT9_RHIID|nr:hypothetical protein GLOIN_2v458148 [Rhizophagus irregularis DAOM 181602=DAOM 197198]POG79677.1 hypothetical protein GLOIN_2v458148 [Rhizophagus irregularis DAOM 181602=DAOM 197198]|eukprot:XP_025186543.1 hypothetical protein GLOIN_2v458148 [Rhizophagus irregularis DAOM 181602=DAOM 197198]
MIYFFFLFLFSFVYYTCYFNIVNIVGVFFPKFFRKESNLPFLDLLINFLYFIIHYKIQNFF